ncbi:dockerin type I domain-containing protein [Bythopirellula polymerisocia]|nr:dockerin type I domain-containing protein [Bythopirellula polymerisocia]
MSNKTSPLHRATSLLTLLAVLTLLSLQSTTRADVTAAGDTNPLPINIPDAGGSIGGDLIIGDTGIAGLFMDFAPPLFGTLAPLESDNGIIGNEEGSIGAATFEDFLGGDWVVANTLTLGNAGQGFLDLFDSASVTALDFIVGALETGSGVGTINGQGSRIRTDGLIVGDLGYGQLEVNSRAVLFSGDLGSDSIIGNDDGGVGVVTVTDIGSRWNVGTSLTNADLIIGNGAGVLTNGQGTLNIANQAQVLVAGTTFVNRDGRVNLTTGGRLRQLTSIFDPIVLEGVISGDGFVDGAVVVGPLGELRNAAGIANLREKLVFSGPVVNDGTIEILGGEMDFNATLVPLINTREIVVRDGVMRYPAGLDNEIGGTVTVGGNSTLHGQFNNNGGDLQILAGSEVLFVGDLTFTAAGLLGLAAGTSSGTLDITGTADLAGAIVALDYSAGVSPTPGDTYQLLSASGGITNFVPQQAAAGGLLWDIDQLGTTDTLFATATAAIAAPVGADFNGDGIVNQLDLQIWQTNYGRTSPPSLAGLGDADGDGDVDGRDLLIIQMKFGGPPLVAALANVPEPSSLVLLLGASLGLIRRRC